MQFLVVLVLNSYRPKAADENITVDSIAVTNDISARAKCRPSALVGQNELIA
jgi:hypothetical protein